MASRSVASEQLPITISIAGFGTTVDPPSQFTLPSQRDDAHDALDELPPDAARPQHRLRARPAGGARPLRRGGSCDVQAARVVHRRRLRHRGRGKPHGPTRRSPTPQRSSPTSRTRCATEVRSAGTAEPLGPQLRQTQRRGDHGRPPVARRHPAPDRTCGRRPILSSTDCSTRERSVRRQPANGSLPPTPPS